MLKLYFFDGEKIADYFLSDKDVNIRDALMVLSGNDTLGTLYSNYKSKDGFLYIAYASEEIWG